MLSLPSMLDGNPSYFPLFIHLDVDKLGAEADRAAAGANAVDHMSDDGGKNI